MATVKPLQAIIVKREGIIAPQPFACQVTDRVIAIAFIIR